MNPALSLIQLIISGLLVGGVYGLIAMGFIVTYRTTQVFNIAYGEFAMFGAFIAWSFIGSPGNPRLPIAPALIITFFIALVFGVLVERFLFRNMVGKPLYAPFIVALGFMAFLQGIVMIVWGPETKVLAETVPTGPIYLGQLVLGKEFIWSFALAIAVSLAFLFFIKNTRLGLAMRASYDNQVAARCLGVNSRLIAQIAWMLSMVIATIGGILIATTSGVNTSLSNMVMVVLAVALLGGMDSLVGALIGGFILAIGTNLSAFYINPHIAGFDSVFSMILILAVLLLRPNGLMGIKPIERV